MENKINIAELLKYCPKGMELDCTVLEDLEFDGIVDSKYAPIRCRVKNPNGGYYVYNFTKYGCWLNTTFAKCVIFPKNKNTWEGFQRPFKDGDVVVAEYAESFQLFLLKHLTLIGDDNSYDGYCYFGWDFQRNELFEKGNWGFNRLATEDEKQKLFQAIKDNGYKWNAEAKTLEKLPKFKVGDVIQDIDTYKVKITEVSIEDGCYEYESIIAKGIGGIPFSEQDNWELVPNKFDITSLKPFESKVLVRDRNTDKWIGAFYSHCKSNGKKFYTIGSSYYYQCIPYEGNEHLLDTTDDCDEYYKTCE